MNKLFLKLIRKCKFKAMSLVEVMVGLLVITCISAAFSPVMVKKLGNLPVSIKESVGITENCNPPFGSACTLCIKHPSKCLQCSKNILACSMDEYADTRACNCNACSTLDVNCIKCENKDKCLQCKEGYYPEGKKCVGCPAGYYCPDGINKVECGEGNYCPPDPDDDEPGGGVGYNTEPTPCPKGKKCPCCTAKQPEPCGAGHYQDMAGQGECKECDQGYKCPAPVCNGNDENCGNTRQIPCQAKEFQDLKGQTTCKGCDPGNMCPSEAMIGQVPCPAGQYQDLSGQTACKNCNSGHACPNSGTDKLDSNTACPKGKYTPADDNGYESCLDCDKGQYQNSTGQSECKNCPTGQYQDLEGQTACKNCDKGKYQNLTGQTTCKDCPAGKYQNLMGQTACKDCDPGKYQDSKGKTSCLSCTVGNMCPVSGASEPTECSSGYYQDTTGQTACKSCDSKVSYCSICEKEDGTCSQCKSGFNLCDGQCKCAADYYLSGGSCVSCPSGLHTKACNTDSVCTPCGDSCLGTCKVDGTCNGTCNKGYYKDTSTNKCVPCPAGQYQDLTGKTSCKPCTTGHYCPNTGMSTPTTCLAGKYQDLTGQTECKPCNTGYYCPADGATTRLMCVAGNYTPNSGNRKICTNCNNGTYCPTDATFKKSPCSDGQYTPNDGGAYKACLKCACGKTSNSDKNGCVNCSAGQYSNASACSTVTKGHYLAADKCSMIDCNPGQYQDTAGQTSCKPCSAGYCKGCASPRKTADGSACNAGTYCTAGQTACSNCSAGHCRNCNTTGKTANGSACNTGTYCTAGQTACSACGKGKYQDETGKSSCKSCTAGYCQGCNVSGKTADGTACNAGKYCTAGQTACSNCSAGHCRNCNTTGKTADGSACKVGTYCTAGQTACSACGSGKYQDEEGKSSCKACSSKTTHCTACNRTTGVCTGCADAYFLNESNKCVEKCAGNLVYIGSNRCMTKYNIGDKGTSLPTDSGRSDLAPNSTTECKTGSKKCCWGGNQTADNYNSDTDYTGQSRRVCNWYAASAICSKIKNANNTSKTGALPTIAQLKVAYESYSKDKGNNGVMFCDESSGHKMAQCSQGTTNKCKGSNDAKCWPFDIWATNYNASLGQYAAVSGGVISLHGDNSSPWMNPYGVSKYQAHSVRCVFTYNNDKKQVKW